MEDVIGEKDELYIWNEKTKWNRKLNLIPKTRCCV